MALELPPTVFKEKIPQQVADVFMQNTYNELHDVAFENGIQKVIHILIIIELYLLPTIIHTFNSVYLWIN